VGNASSWGLYFLLCVFLSTPFALFAKTFPASRVLACIYNQLKRHTLSKFQRSPSMPSILPRNESLLASISGLPLLVYLVTLTAIVSVRNPVDTQVRSAGVEAEESERKGGSRR